MTRIGFPASRSEALYTANTLIVSVNPYESFVFPHSMRRSRVHSNPIYRQQTLYSFLLRVSFVPLSLSLSLSISRHHTEPFPKLNSTLLRLPLPWLVTRANRSGPTLVSPLICESNKKSTNAPSFAKSAIELSRYAFLSLLRVARS